MAVDPELIRAVELTSARRARSEARAAQDAADQATAIAAAMKGGASPNELVTITGLTRARLYQIRDAQK